MRGEYEYSMDAKGRLNFPADLRRELGEGFVIFRGLDHNLWVYTAERWAEFEQKLTALPTKARSIQQFYSANFVCEPDAQGRVLIPQPLRGYAGFKRDVTFVGTAGRVELWDSETWKAHCEKTDPDAIAELMDSMGI